MAPAQKEKITRTGLNEIAEVAIISDEVGVRKPDRRIFVLALNALGVAADKAPFVGDNLMNDIYGCQSAGIKGIWFNPNRLSNKTDIAPFAEINNLTELMQYIP